MNSQAVRLVSEYGRMLSQVLCDVMEHNYLHKQAPYNLTRTQFSILKLLSNSGSFLGSELSQILNISRPAVSKNIDKLVRQKLVSRKILKTDRRTSELNILKAGRDIVQKFEMLRLKKQEAALKNMSAGDQEKLAELLGRYVRNCINQEESLDLICLQCDDEIAQQCIMNDPQHKCQYFIKKKEKIKS